MFEKTQSTNPLES